MAGHETPTVPENRATASLPGEDAPDRKRPRRDESAVNGSKQELCSESYGSVGNGFTSRNQFSALAAFRLSGRGLKPNGKDLAEGSPEVGAPAFEHLANVVDQDSPSEGDASSADERPVSSAKNRRSRDLPGDEPAVVRVSSSMPSRQNTMIARIGGGNDRSFAFLGMSQGERLVLEGFGAVGCLRGVCSVAGFKIVADADMDQWFSSDKDQSPPLAGTLLHPVFSLRSQSLLSIYGGADQAPLPRMKDSRMHTEDLGSPDSFGSLADALAECRTRLHSFAIVVVLADIWGCGLESAPSDMPNYRDLFGDIEETNGPRYSLPLVRGLCCHVSLAYPGLRTPLEIAAPWKSTLDRLTAAAVEERIVVVVVGPKGSGKSTFARLLTNSLLERASGRVEYLDTDVGQSEFAPFGCVSLQEIKQPLLGPPFTHFARARRSLFVGSSSPDKDPDHYVDCLRTLVSAHQEQRSPEAALVVNTHGWVKGMGFDILMALVDLLSPTHVVDLRFDGDDTRNVSPVVLGVGVRGGGCEAIALPAAGTAAGRRQHAAELRQVALTSYFHQTSVSSLAAMTFASLDTLERYWDFDVPVTVRRPLAVPWGLVAVGLIHAEVSERDILRAINGAVVALCEGMDGAADGEVAASTVRHIRSPVTTAHHVLGLGIVRAIDFASQTLHIVTPIQLNAARKCTLVLRSADMEVPVELRIRGLGDQGQPVPYTMLMGDHGLAGAKEWKTRSNLARRSQAA
ncbi:Pre-mRNA cleavage complex II protein Clp1-domain-containing protein [Hyaloraphidium curvatum]|nr:Pre-mRNA cleavage complex II protein Clp1-domain-containing protein [Hyaloraphidium curvatum]